jgi:hypothetical protein
MPCSLSITSVTGIPAAGRGVSLIHVTGTLTGDCEPIVVSRTVAFDATVPPMHTYDACQHRRYALVVNV